ncbi:MAG: hypothetical protein GY696_11345 [Gammaproteobacteria bacterium]|nr:hypothetical protein [Gammaproteobacteria bacterium]
MLITDWKTNTTAAHCVEVCSGQEGCSIAPKNISCVFKGQGNEYVLVARLLDSGNLIPESAAMSMEFADRIGVRWEPYQLEVGTAAQGGNLEVVGRIPTLEMTIAPKLTFKLTDTLVIRDLSHPLNLSLRFLKEYKAQLDYTTAEPQLWIEGKQILMVTQLETKETTRRREPERADLNGKPAWTEPMEPREETDLPGVDLIPPDKISVFNSLCQQYTNSLNFLNESLSPYTICRL